MNVYPSISITPASAVLTCVSGLAWAAALAIAVIDLTSMKVLAVSIGVGITGAVCAVALECTVRVVDKVKEHAQRVEEHERRVEEHERRVEERERRVEEQAQRMDKAMADHAELLAKHGKRVLALDRFFALGVESDRLARLHSDGMEPWDPRGINPFKVHNGDGG